MLAKSGIGFILGDNQQAVDKITSVAISTGIEPRWIKVHNSVKHIQQLRQACPNSRLMLRLTATEWRFQGYISQLEAGYAPDPNQSAADYWTATKAILGTDIPKQLLWIEPCPPGFSSWSHSAWLNTYFLAIMRLMEADGFHAYICNFYTGTPHTRSDGTDGWTPFMPAIQYATSHGHVIGAHAYWQLPDTAMVDPGNWTAYRPLRVINDYQFPSGMIWVPSEYGFDGPGGYRNHGISGDSYYDAIVRADQTFRNAIYPLGVRVDGFTLYILQAWGSEWDSFLFWEIFDRLLAYIVSQGADTGTPPPPPPPSPTIKAVQVVINGVNQRSGPGSTYNLLGFIAVSSPRARLIVDAPAVNNYYKVHGQDFWIYAPNTAEVV